jgi:hypothetical protein
VSICYHPHAFDAERFAVEVGTCTTVMDLIEALAICAVHDPHFGWSLDEAVEDDIIGGRVHPDQGTVSLVENVRSALDPVGQAEAVRLLGHVSEFDGRLVAVDTFAGYLMPDEIRRVSTLLDEVPFSGSAGQDEDRRLLLRLFAIALKDDRGLYWTWF